MRLVIDLQAAQGDSAGRGIGRFSRALAVAMVEASGKHDPLVLLNAAMDEQTEVLHAAFTAILPRANVRLWRGLTRLAETGGPANRARRRASETIRAQAIAGLAPDLIHVASMVEGGSDDVVSAWPTGLVRLPQVATFYDAIPMINRDQYLGGAWQAAGLTGWYLRHVQELRRCEALMAISQSSRNEAVDYLGFNPLHVHTIWAGCDPTTFRPAELDRPARAALLARYGLREGFVLFVGAGDLRKNEAGLLQAYATLPDRLRARHQLAIAGAMDPLDLLARAKLLGLSPDELVLIRYIPEADLPALYATCQVFVMPSKHEGFGLPALEAMACGAAVIVSNTTSLPEVVGTPEALFDPHDPHSISEKLAAVLTNVGLRERLAAHGLARAQRFTWAQSARLAWTALEEVQSRTPPMSRPMSRPGAVLARKLRLAFVSPLPPDATGIADYARDLLPDLARHYDITLVNRSGTTSDTTLRALFPVISEARFANEAGSFPRIVYQIGNSEFHSKIVTELLQQFTGVAVLHDAYLSNIPLIAFLNGGGLRALVIELLESHGWGAVRALHFAAPAAAVRDFPCTLPVFRAALGVIQHSAHARDIAERHIGPEAAALIRLVPHARASWPPMGRTTARSRLDLNLVQPVIVSLGMVAPTKRPTTVLRGWHIAFGQDNSARLAFVGPILPELASELRAEAERLGVGGRVTLTGRVDENTYRLWLEAADIAVQLRMGSRGETSGAVADAMGAGLPVIVSDHGAMAELPPGAVMLVEDNADCAAVGTALARLWSDAGLRAAIGQAAASYVCNELSPVRVAGLYRDAIEEFHALGAPARQLAALPDLPEFDLPEAAQALVHSFQTVARPRLLLDVSCIDDASETQCGIVRTLLTNPGDAWYADLIRLGDGPAHHDRRNAARLLGLPDHALPEPTLVGGPSDIVVLAVRHAPWPDGAVLELARLRREGARVVALLDGAWLPGAPGRAVTTALAIADAVLCRSHDEAALVMHWLDGGLGDRRRPLEIGLLPEPDQPSVGPKRAPGSVALLERPHAANVTSAHERLCALLTSGAPWPLRWLPRGVAYR